MTYWAFEITLSFVFLRPCSIKEISLGFLVASLIVLSLTPKVCKIGITSGDKVSGFSLPSLSKSCFKVRMTARNFLPSPTTKAFEINFNSSFKI